MDIILDKNEFIQKNISGISDDVEEVWVNKELTLKSSLNIDKNLPIVAIASIIRSNRKV